MSGLLRRAAAPSVALLAIASSAIGIFNGFTYDDAYVVEQNPLMKHLHGWWHVFRLSYWPKSAGGDGYRPLTILAFRIEAVVGHAHHAAVLDQLVAGSLRVVAHASGHGG